MMMVARSLALAAGIFAAFSGAAFAQQTAKPIELIVFPGGFNWPIWTAVEKGFFARRNVNVKITPTPNSQFQLTGLIDGKFDIAMTAIDNVIAYMEGQGSAPTATKPDIFAFMGGDNGFLRLVTVPEVKSMADLVGKQLSVDALTTGYAFVLRKLVDTAGIGKDVQYVSAGGVVQRFQALMEKKHAGTLLISPFEVEAEAKGFNRLANGSEALGAYQGLVGAVRRDWAQANEAQIIGYVQGYIAALDWLYSPANKAEAIAILRKNAPNMAELMATRSYDVLLDPKTGFARKAELSEAGVRTVLELRSEYGQPAKALSNPQLYYDLAYYRKATAR